MVPFIDEKEVAKSLHFKTGRGVEKKLLLYFIRRILSFLTGYYSNISVFFWKIERQVHFCTSLTDYPFLIINNCTLLLPLSFFLHIVVICSYKNTKLKKKIFSLFQFPMSIFKALFFRC